MEIKSHLFEIMQFCLLRAVFLFCYLSVLLKPNFLKKWKNTWFSHAQSHILFHNSPVLQPVKSCMMFSCTRCPRSGELRTKKLKSHLLRTQSLRGLSFKPGIGQYIAIHATLTARDFFRADFYPRGHECSRNINKTPKHVWQFFCFCVPKLLIEFELWFEKKKKRFVVYWLVEWIAWRQLQVCV